MKVIVDLAGGLGNQLFCYCFGYAVSKKTNSKFVLDTSMQDCGIARELELLNFNVDYSDRISYVYKTGLVDRMFFNKVRKIKSIGIKTRIYQEKEPTKFEPEAFEISNMLFHLRSELKTYPYETAIDSTNSPCQLSTLCSNALRRFSTAVYLL